MKNKLSRLVCKIKNIYEEVYTNYRMTMILVDITMAVAIVYSIFSDYNSKISSKDQIYRVVEWLFRFFAYLTAGSFGIESFQKKLLEKYKVLKISVGMVIAAVISCMLTILSTGWILGCVNVKNTFYVHDNRLIAFNIAYLVLIALSVFYQRYKESDFAIEKYFVHVFTQIIQISIVWGILAVGFLLLSVIFETLIDAVVGGYIVPQILIIGLYVIPAFLMGITKVKDEVGGFFEVLIKYVMLIITIVGAAIIYLYIIKTIFVLIPSNEIFAIASALFFVAIPVGFACTAFARDSFLQKIAYALPYIYAPFILLQIYSLAERIFEYGLTPARYAGIVLIVLEILYTLVYIFGRKYIDKLILVMMLVTACSTVVPGINAIDLSRITQKSLITRFLENGMPSTENGMTRLAAAYDFLKDECGNEYLDGILSQKHVEQIKEISQEMKTSSFKSYSLSSDSTIIPTDGYKYISEFESGIYSNSEERNPSKMILEVDGEEFGPIDFSEEYDSIKKRCEDGDGKIQGPDIIKLSDDCELYIEYADISEDSSDGYIARFRLEGYVLMNQPDLGTVLRFE